MEPNDAGPKTWLDRDFDRTAAAILGVNDCVPDRVLRARLRRTILNELELLKLRVVVQVAEKLEG